jgi:glycosyltransferase involved in cell wall biosynthesis
MSRKRLGIVDLSVPGWTAGRSYTEGLLRSLLLAGASESFDLIRMASRGGNVDALDALPIQTHRFEAATTARLDAWLRSRAAHAPPRLLAQVARFGGRAAQKLGRSELLSEGARLRLSALVPLQSLGSTAPFGTVGWIPDFQHVYEPRFFSLDECAARDVAFHALAENASRVMLSSQTVSDHFAAFDPPAAPKARVARFPSTFAFRDLPPEHGAAVRRYGLPAKFALVVNQFWQHKNHLAVVEGVAKARDLGAEVPLAMVGAPADYRDPENETVSRVLQRIAMLGLSGTVRVLGRVPLADLIDLLRSAALIVQPSRFEGWSTTVEDAKALGRPLLCSDIAVHREQAPTALGFFGCDDTERLGLLLSTHWPLLGPGQGAVAEGAPLARAKQCAFEFGRTVTTICKEIS